MITLWTYSWASMSMAQDMDRGEIFDMMSEGHPRRVWRTREAAEAAAGYEIRNDTMWGEDNPDRAVVWIRKADGGCYFDLNGADASSDGEDGEYPHTYRVYPVQLEEVHLRLTLSSASYDEDMIFEVVDSPNVREGIVRRRRISEISGDGYTDVEEITGRSGQDQTCEFLEMVDMETQGYEFEI